VPARLVQPLHPVRSQQHSKCAVGEDQLQPLVQLSRVQFSLGGSNLDLVNRGQLKLGQSNLGSPRAGEAMPVETIGVA
jgi:hypothetical protein